MADTRTRKSPHRLDGDDADDGDAGLGGAGWDDAVEAFRDRRKLRANRTERLRAAGFSERDADRLTGAEAAEAVLR
ncbi:hypothetical protein GGS23DRAFT_592991 [Durotheca rogersii]|uniref:uncharacterized protein n=1 Tax=Durotheca rogersii TaxID=419775 RepID=UPI0022209FAA|nr:uncharacterized protein GGS23DRAFT_592991 [Durotheca rogersii]KAI5867705.1 hypothetical protein GGS23DRAFT_592991 [Durotheca rogersii]